MTTKPDTAVTTCDNCYLAKATLQQDTIGLCPKHAATDDLLQALQDAVETLGVEVALHRTHCSCGSHGRVTPVLDAARQAIARATGEAQKTF